MNQLLNQLLPFAGCILGYFGAEIIKVEPPNTGDALRNWRVLDEDNTSYWWRSMARNKKCITIKSERSNNYEEEDNKQRSTSEEDVVTTETSDHSSEDGMGRRDEGLEFSNPGRFGIKINFE